MNTQRSVQSPSLSDAQENSNPNYRWIRIPLFALILFLVGNLILRGMLLGQGLQPLGLKPMGAFGVTILGMLSDLHVAGWPIGLGLLYLVLAPRRLLRSKFHGLLLRGVLILGTGIFLFELLAEWFFWDEFQSRFNFVAVDYLVYTTEVLDNIWESYPIVPLISAIAVLALVIHTLSNRWLSPALRQVPSRRVALGALLLVVLFQWSSGQLSTRLGTSASANRYAEELEANGLQTLVSAFRNPTLDYKTFYLSEDDGKVYERTRALIDDGKGIFTDPNNTEDITRTYAGDPKRASANVMLIVVESLSGHYLRRFGDKKNKTPNLNALADKSVFFDNFFATGCRTVRGLEAITLSIPPTPGRSVIKRSNNEGLASIGTVMRTAGYDTKFLYGGYSYFDEMSGFFSSNGFEIVDRADLSSDEVTFSNAWGVCDQDLFGRALREADKSAESDKPFFQMVMTTSNHRPYTYPQVIEIESGSGREGAVRYTDFAIGELLEKAKDHAWFDNTYFVVVADHCASSAGKREINLERHHIPCLIYAPALVQPRHVEAVASQIDLAPTLLSLLGIEYTDRSYGKNILDGESGPGRALVGNYQVLGLYQADQLTLLKPKKQSAAYKVGTDFKLEPTEVSEGPLFDVISYYQSASQLLQDGMLTAPKQ